MKKDTFSTVLYNITHVLASVSLLHEVQLASGSLDRIKLLKIFILFSPR